MKNFRFWNEDGVDVVIEAENGMEAGRLLAQHHPETNGHTLQIDVVEEEPVKHNVFNKPDESQRCTCFDVVRGVRCPIHMKW